MRSVLAAALLLPLAAWASTRRDDALQPQAPGEILFPDQLPAVLPAPSFLEAIGIMSLKQTRGERNNNPGNIRQSAANWLGKVPGGDPAFETFDTAVNGIRAAARTLRNYQTVHGLRTVRQIVARWAPASENNTAAYVAAVARELGVSPDADLNLQDAAVLERLTAAIIHHENGRVIYDQAEIAAGVRLA